MRIVCIGGGPAGLFFSIVMKSARPGARIEVFERNRADDTFGWGVVFSDQTLGNIAAADPPTYERIVESFVHWDAIDVHFRGRTLRAGGQGFAGIARKRLLQILQARAAELGVELHFASEIGEEAHPEADLIVVADGANSATRRRHAERFGTTLEARRNRYIWLGTEQQFASFTFAFEETPHGWFQIHAYQFDRALGTVIVECREETWRAAGLDRASTAESLAFCERLFAPYLGGHRLMSNAAHLANPWIAFVQVSNARWFDGNRVLVGDAAHTAHFSIGSGTKLALEDAIGLAKAKCAVCAASPTSTRLPSNQRALLTCTNAIHGFARCAALLISRWPPRYGANSRSQNASDSAVLARSSPAARHVSSRHSTITVPSARSNWYAWIWNQPCGVSSNAKVNDANCCSVPSQM